MSRMKDLKDRYKTNISLLAHLDELYQGSIKGEAYHHRYKQLMDRLKDLRLKMLNLGTTENVLIVKSRAYTQVGKGVFKEVNYKTFFSNISKEDVLFLMSVMHPEQKGITIEEITLGKPIPVKGKL